MHLQALFCHFKKGLHRGLSEQMGRLRVPRRAEKDGTRLGRFSRKMEGTLPWACRGGNPLLFSEVFSNH